MKIVNLKEINDGYTFQQIPELCTQIKESLQTPMNLGKPSKVAYRNGYMIMFEGGKNIQMTASVAGFIVNNLHKRGIWVGRIEDGFLVDVNLIQFNKD